MLFASAAVFAQASAPATADQTPVEQLKPVIVKRDRTVENGAGPVNGYVAKRSEAGTKTDTPLIETPQSISVIGTDQMQAQAANTVGEALRYTPGVNGEVYGGADTREDFFMVRGFVQNFPFIDGLNTQTFFSVLAPSVDTYGLERVEVLRGPASVLYGQAYPGGLINLVTKKPTEEPLHEISIETGTYGEVGTHFDFSGPVNKDGTLLYRLTGLATSSGTQTAFVQDKRFYIAPALTWKPNADTSFTLLTHYGYRDGGNPSVDLPAVGTLFSNPNGQISTGFYDRDTNFDTFRRKEASVGWQFEHAFSDNLKVRQNLRYTHADLTEELIGNAGLESDDRTLDRYAYKAIASVDTFAVDNQAEAKFNTGPLSHTMLFGVDYLHSVDHWAEQDASSVSSLDLYNPVYGASVVLPDVDYSVKHQLDQVGVYVQDQIRFGRWVASLSGRQDWSTSKTIDRLANTTQTNDGNKFTYRAGLVYLFDSGIAPYASYSTSFQPGLGETYNGTALKPTTGQSMEAGVKYQPPGQNSFVMASVFNIKQQNVVETDYVHTDGSYVVQTGERRVRGAELSGTADFGHGLKAVAAYTYMDGVITASDTGTQGNQANNVPHHSASLWIDKTLQGGPLIGLGFGAGVRFIGSRFGDDANELKLSAVTLFDAGVHYDITHWRFSLNAKNLFDRIYVNCQSMSYCSYGLRRQVLARATYQW